MAEIETANVPEKELWVGRPSQLINIKTYLVCTLLCFLIVPIFIALWKYIETRACKYELTSQRFRTSSGVFTRLTHELELYRVKDTTYMQTFFQRIFGLATVGMTTSDASHPYIEISSIAAKEANDVRESIRNAVEELRERKRVRELDYT